MAGAGAADNAPDPGDPASGDPSAPLRVVIQVPVDAIQAHADGTAKVDEAKERSRITKY